MPMAQRAESLTTEPTASRTRPTTWVAAPLGNRGLIAASVIFPATKAALTPRPLGRFRSVALLRLVDGTVWLLSMPGRAWTAARLDIAARLLAAGSANPEPREAVQQRLRMSLDLPDLTLSMPCLDTVDSAQWGLPDTARSVVLRGTELPAMVRRATDPKGRIRAAESVLLSALSAALATFVSELDTEALALTSKGGAIDAHQYNYLAYRAHRRYRMQFAVAFPNLLPVAATAASGTLGKEVRAAVDSGRPLVKTLAQDWSVRPGVVRELMGMRPGAIGQHWTADIRALAQLLHALRPEDLPGDDPSRWQRFEAAVALGSQLFHEPMHRSTAARCWLHACVGQLRRGSPATRARWLPDADALNRIQRFRAILTETLRRDVGAVNVDAEQAVSAFLAQAVDRLLADLAAQGLADTATAFETERARTVQGVVTPQETRRIASGRMLLPLLPRDFVSADGSRIVRALTTEQQLAEQGEALDICLGGAQRFNYLALCRHGWRFVVGVFEAATDAPLSTADIALRIVADAGAGDSVLKQHTARENQEPSLPCRRAVAELLAHCRSPAVQRHLDQGRRLLRQGGTTQMARFREQADAQTQAADRAALRTTLGSGVYDDLVAAAVCARRQHASAH